MSESIRTFIAFELPPVIISLLQKVQQELILLKLRVRWVHPANIHLTLKFLGDIDPGGIDKIGAAMAEAVIGSSPLKLAGSGIGVFPGIKRPRVIWLGLGGDIQALLALQGRLEEKLAGLGFPNQKRSFKAHLTLGRIKQAVSQALIRQMLNEYATLHSDDATFNQVILYKSDLKPSGAVYTKLKQINFGMTNDNLD